MQKSISFVLSVLFSGILFTFTGAQTVYYVSPAGNDSSPGTPAFPFKTIQHCVDQWDGTNQYECRCAGTFHEEVVITKGGPSKDARNRLIAWDTDNDTELDDETFILDGEDSRNIGISIPSPKPDNVEIAYMTIQNYEPDGGCGDGQPLHCIQFHWGSGGANWWIHHNTFQDMGDTCDWSTSGASYIGLRPSGTPYLIVENNIFRNIGGYIMRYFGGTGIKFRNNYVEVVSTGLKPWGNTDSLEVTDNIFVCDGSGGNPDSRGCLSQSAVAFADDLQYSVIRGNVFFDCVGCISFATESVYGSRDNAYNIVENNIIIRSPKVCNIYAAPVGISDCTDPSSRTGDSMEVRDIVFRNNIINYVGGTEQGSAIVLTSGHPFTYSNNIAFYNNTINNYRYAVRIDQCSKPYAYELNNITFKNNIFSKVREDYYALGTWSGGWSGNPPENWISDYNTFSNSNDFDWQGTKTLSEWQQATGQDMHSKRCAPDFTASDTVHLTSQDTCALDAGTTLTGFSSDIDGDTRPQGAAWDIGADEYTTGDRIEDVYKRYDILRNGLIVSPNPFTQRTAFSFFVPGRRPVSLAVFNVSGQKVLSVFRDDSAAWGFHSIRFNGSKLKAGMYVARLVINRRVYSKKLVILK